MNVLDQAIGWTLLHSLWEGAAAALALAIVLGVTRSSRIRYAAACVAMLAVLAGFGVTFYRLRPRHDGGRMIVRILPSAVNFTADDGPVAMTHTWDATDLLPWLAPLWMAGVLLFQLRCLASWIGAARLRRIGVCGAPDAWFERLDALRLRLRMTRSVALLESCFAEVPAVIGHLRPVILVPVGLLAGLPAGQVEAILLHELAHIRRGDYLVNLMQTVVEGLLFYHPAVWWISTVIRAERENCCDDLVVATSGDAHEYATALAALAENRWTMREPALAATGGNLVKRIRRLLAQPEGPRTAIAPVLSAGILIVTCAVALVAWQTPQRSAPAIVPVIPVTPAPAVEAFEQTQVTPMARPIAPTRMVGLKAQPEALEQLRDLMQKLEIKRGVSRFMLALAQDNPSAQANPAPWPYQKWLDEVSYIITDAERKAFKSLVTNDEREMFIQQFWARRDPAYPQTTAPEEYPTIPKGNPENAYKKEFYRRIAYVNDRFADKKVAGWKTDRGRIYIQYGPPNEIDSHPSGGKYERPAEEGGGQTVTYPFEQWRYRQIDGIGANVIFEFVDKARTGEYKLTTDPAEKDMMKQQLRMVEKQLAALPAQMKLLESQLEIVNSQKEIEKLEQSMRALLASQAPIEQAQKQLEELEKHLQVLENPGAVFLSTGPGEKAVVVVGPDKAVLVTIPIDYDATRISTTVTSSEGKTVGTMGAPLTDPCEGKPADSGCRNNYTKTFPLPPLPPGSYVMTTVVTDSNTWTEKTYVVNFTVN
ncbi:MAG: M56 family metallopeptidase [Bryobacteraceae bacterium]